MKTITDKKYEEYLALKRWAKREKVWQSASGIQYLEDDIDAPIKRCVAMTALLGLEPLFSCCGFDYHGQPYHKSHQYGEPYIMVKSNDLSKKWLTMSNNSELGYGWRIRKSIGSTILIVLKIQGNPYWRKKDCIHFSEESAIGISNLERMLYSLRENFVNEYILVDTNQNYKKAGIRYWQYPPKEPWTIRKEFLDRY